MENQAEILSPAHLCSQRGHEHRAQTGPQSRILILLFCAMSSPLPTPAPAQPDALALAQARLSLLGAELSPCRSADDVAALLTAMAMYPAGMHNRAQHIGDELGISTFEVERLLVRLADRPAWMELSQRPALHVPSADELVLVPDVRKCVACGGTSFILSDGNRPTHPTVYTRDGPASTTR